MVSAPVRVREEGGAALTVPLTATFCVLAPLLTTVTLPASEPTLAPVRRTEICVGATVPALGVRLTDDAKLVPLVETAKPVGAVMRMVAVRLDPLALNVWAGDAVPTVVLKPVRLLVEAATEGGGAGLTVPERLTMRVPAPALVMVREPVFVPKAALPDMRT